MRQHWVRLSKSTNVEIMVEITSVKSNFLSNFIKSISDFIFIEKIKQFKNDA